MLKIHWYRLVAGRWYLRHGQFLLADDWNLRDVSLFSIHYKCVLRPGLHSQLRFRKKNLFHFIKQTLSAMSMNTIFCISKLKVQLRTNTFGKIHIKLYIKNIFVITILWIITAHLDWFLASESVRNLLVNIFTLSLGSLHTHRLLTNLALSVRNLATLSHRNWSERRKIMLLWRLWAATHLHSFLLISLQS